MNEVITAIIAQLTLENVFSISVLLLFVRGAWIATDLARELGMVLIDRYRAKCDDQHAQGEDL